MRSLLSVSLASLLLLTSCSPSLTRGYRRAGVERVAKEKLPVAVDAAGGVQKYNLSLTFGKRHFSGMLLVRRSGEDTFRMVLSTHFGLTVFDFELTPDAFRVHHCVEPLRKEKILSLFRRDFSCLFGLNLQEENEAVIYRKKDGLPKEVYKFVARKPRCWYEQDVEKRRLERMKVGSGWGSALFDFPAWHGGVPSSIRISHSGLPLRIELERM